jgi:hypothetical protein
LLGCLVKMAAIFFIYDFDETEQESAVLLGVELCKGS